MLENIDGTLLSLSLSLSLSLISSLLLWFCLAWYSSLLDCIAYIYIHAQEREKIFYHLSIFHA